MQPCYKCTLVVKIACNTKTCGSLPALEILLIVQIHSMVIFLVFYLKPFNIFYLFLSLHFETNRVHLDWDFVTHLQIDSSAPQLGLFTVHASHLRAEVSAAWGPAAGGSTGCTAEAASAPAPGWARWAQDAAGGPSSLSQIVSFSPSLCVTPHLGQ